jgi:hypothetical protein
VCGLSYAPGGGRRPGSREGRCIHIGFGREYPLPYVNQDAEQLKVTQTFLKTGKYQSTYSMARTAAPAPQTEKKKTVRTSRKWRARLQ